MYKPFDEFWCEIECFEVARLKIIVIWDVTPCILVYGTYILLPSSGWQKQRNIFVKDGIVLDKDEKGDGTGRPVLVVRGVVQ